MMIQVLQKRAQIRLSIRRQSKDQLFSNLRQTALNSLFLKQLSDLYAIALNTRTSIDEFFQLILSHLLSLQSQGQHFAAVSTLLRINEDLMIARGSVSTFVRLAEAIIEGPNLDAASDIASIKFIKWLFLFLLKDSQMHQYIQDRASVVCYQLSLLYRQSNHHKHETFQESTIHQVIATQLSSALTSFSKRLLTIALIFADSSQLTYQHKCKLTFLANFLFAKVQTCFLQAPSVQDYLLLSIGCLVEFRQNNFQIFSYLLKRFSGDYHRQILEMIQRQSEQSSLVVYYNVRETLLEARNQIYSVSEQKVFLFILRNLIVNQSSSFECVSTIYQDFLAGKVQVLIQRSFLSPLISLLTAIASCSAQAFDQCQLIDSCVKCIQFSYSQRQSKEEKRQLSFLKLKLILQLTLERYLTMTKAIVLSEHLMPSDQKYFLETVNINDTIQV